MSYVARLAHVARYSEALAALATVASMDAAKAHIAKARQARDPANGKHTLAPVMFAPYGQAWPHGARARCSGLTAVLAARAHPAVACFRVAP